MVSLLTSLVTTAVALTIGTSSAAQSLPVGEFYRPHGAEVSGFVNATTAYVRSPCPALNTLSNHGFLSRDGKNITRAQISDALRGIFNIGGDLIREFVERIPEVISLSDLSKHDFIEHDASLVHADASTGVDPATVDQDLWEELLSHAKNGQLGAKEMAAVRRERIARCKGKATDCVYGPKQRVLALGESSMLLHALGGKNTESISVDFAKAFLVDERIPAEYKKPTDVVGLAGVLVTAGNIQLLALFQDLVAFFWRW